MLDAATLLASDGGSVIAPAGCGKTELIAETVRALAHGRALVLTHTHAGVRALRDRLQRGGVPRDRAAVYTIAGWCHRFACAYPNSAHLKTTQPEGPDWNLVYPAAEGLLQIAALRRVVAASYAAVFVDEYQDCTHRQHSMITRLADLVPTWVLGDPLQGIFRFGGGDLSWVGDVQPAFPPRGELSKPWRWHGKNEPLGHWLLEIRRPLMDGLDLDLRSGPLRWRALSLENQHDEAMRLHRDAAQAVAIRKWAADAHEFARVMGGRFLSMEETDCKDLMSFSSDMDKATGTSRAVRLIWFAGACMTEAPTAFDAVRAQFAAGSIPDPTRCKHPSIVDALVAVSGSSSPHHVVVALDKIESLPNARLFRKELWLEAKKTFVECAAGRFASLRAAAWSLRNRQRSLPRPVERRSVSRTLLVKGLEFDHALVLDAMEFEDPKSPGDGARHFYVAATRGSRSLSILSPSPIVRFSAAQC